MHPKREKASLWRFLLLHLCQCGITQLRTGTWICWSKWARSLPGSSITCLLETRRFRNSYPLPGSVKSCTGESVLTEIPSQFSPLISSMTPKANELWESSHSCDGCGACTRKGWPINGLCCRGKTGVPCRLLEVVWFLNGRIFWKASRKFVEETNTPAASTASAERGTVRMQAYFCWFAV